MNAEQLYQMQKDYVIKTSGYEKIYNTGKRWSIANGNLAYVRKGDVNSYQLCRVNLGNAADREIITTITSEIPYEKGGDFSVIFEEDAVFIYRLLYERDYVGNRHQTGVELFRWEQKNGNAIPMPTKVIRTNSQVEGFDLENVYCSDRHNGSYRISAISIETGAVRTVLENHNRDLGKVLVLKSFIVAYDYVRDEDSVGCPTNGWAYRVISKSSGEAREHSGMHYIIDSRNSLAWGREKMGMAEYLIPYRLASLVSRTVPVPHSLAPVWKLPQGILAGTPDSFYFDGCSLLVNQSWGGLECYNQAGQKASVSANCNQFGIAGGYIYAKSNLTRVCPQNMPRLLNFSLEELMK